MAYAKLADLPVQYGLYTSFFGALCYWVFGTSKDISIGPVAVASLVTGGIIGDVLAIHPGDDKKAMIASVTALLAGALIFVIGLLRLGWLIDLISLSAVSAFITGSALTITFSQIPILLGIREVSSSRDPVFRVGLNTIKHLNGISIDATFGISALILLYIIKWTCLILARTQLKRAKTIFFISTLRTVLVLLIFTLSSYLVNRNRRDYPLIKILGFIPRGTSVVNIFLMPFIGSYAFYS
jgi:solute carrier family 26 (sodium-independent sulfate anion transporter), member 11